MVEINRVGDLETVKPDPELMKIANRVIDLNEKILAQNAELIRAVATPVYLLKNLNDELDKDSRQ